MFVAQSLQHSAGSMAHRHSIQGIRWRPLLGRRSLLTAALLVSTITAAVPAQAGKPTVCCRVAGGTRGTCLNQWLHLVPPANRVNPGPARVLGLLQGVPPQPAGGSADSTAITVQFTTESGQRLAGQTLPPAGPGVWLLTLPADWPPQRQALIWESYPSCQPYRPPTRTLLVPVQDGEQAAQQQALAELARSCGARVDTQALLRRFDLVEAGQRFALPADLPVRCQALELNRPALSTDRGRSTNP